MQIVQKVAIVQQTYNERQFVLSTVPHVKKDEMWQPRYQRKEHHK